MTPIADAVAADPAALPDLGLIFASAFGSLASLARPRTTTAPPQTTWQNACGVFAGIGCGLFVSPTVADGVHASPHGAVGIAFALSFVGILILSKFWQYVESQTTDSLVNLIVPTGKNQ